MLGTQGQVVAYNDEGISGFLSYQLLRSPCATESDEVFAIRVFAAKAEQRGLGTARALYDELRDAHPRFLIGADHYLTGDGRVVAMHYRRKYPDRHVGRFDTSLVLHRTSEADDPAYLPTHFTASDSPIRS